jgi:3-dehydroquinate synthase
MESVQVALGDRSYTIEIGQGILEHLPRMLSASGMKGVCAVVTDENVGPLYAKDAAALVRIAGLEPVVCTIPAGESQKRLTRIEELTGQFLEAGLDRAGGLVALGGGVVGDVAGFAAASYMRGIPYVQVPTTIVAQVDSSVGGKTAVNHPLGKNIIGAFHQPAGVLIDMKLLETLPERELRAGLAEVIKHGIIADEGLFSYMQTHAKAILAKDLDALEYPVKRSCEIKAHIVSEDEREHGVRANLNYGHTFGHGIEASTGYTTFLHGEAIALGMCAAGHLARHLGLVDDEFVDEQAQCIAAYGLPTSWDALDVSATLAAMKRDKKARAGTLKFVLAEHVGRVVHRTDISEELAGQALEAIQHGG